MFQRDCVLKTCVQQVRTVIVNNAEEDLDSEEDESRKLEVLRAQALATMCQVCSDFAADAPKRKPAKVGMWRGSQPPSASSKATI